MKFENLNEVEAWSAGGPPPPGKYTVKIDDASEGESSGGHPQLELSFTVADGPFAGAEFRDWLVVLESTRGKVVALLQAAGVEIPAGEFELDPKALIGRHCEVVIREEPSFKDPTKMVNRVAGYRAPSGQPNGSNGATQAADEAPLPF